MGVVFIGVLAGILVGFGWLASSQGHFLGCTWHGCFDRAAISQSIEPQAAASRPDIAIAKAKSQVKSAAAATSSKRSSAERRKRTAHAKKAAPPARTRVAASDHHIPDASDPVLIKAKATIAAKMEVPASAEFSDLDRAIRLNTFGRPVDTICGHVKGKNASGDDTGEKPFLYLVKDDDAYVVDGKAESAAAIAYRNICH
jgi:hypothetical protein